MRDIQADLIGKQYGALNTGYQNASATAQTDLNRALQSGQAFERLGQSQQGLGAAGLKTMSDYGSQQQAQGQRMLDYPMAQTQQFAKLLQGYNQIPMGKTSQVTASPGYSTSPLAQIGGLSSLVASIYKGGNKDGGVINKAHGGGVRLADGGMAPSGAEYHDGNGNFYDADGYLLE